MKWEASLNNAMYKARITMKCFSKEEKMLWAFVDCKSHLKVLQMLVGLIFQASTMLTNLDVFEPIEISKYF